MGGNALDDPTAGPDGRHARRLGDVLVHPGGEGTPGVQDFCLGEIALARGTGVTATSNALADVLDLQHRLPHLVGGATGEAEVYVACRVAKLSRHLPAARVGVVDAAVARVIAHESGGRTLAVAEAKVIEADPALHDERIEAERARRYVGYGRTDELGLRTVIARIDAGDAVWFGATLERVTEILAPPTPSRRRRAPRHRVRLPRPSRRAAPAPVRAHRSRAGPRRRCLDEPGDGVLGGPPRRPP